MAFCRRSNLRRLSPTSSWAGFVLKRSRVEQPRRGESRSTLSGGAPKIVILKVFLGFFGVETTPGARL